MFYPSVNYVKKIHSYIIDSEGGIPGILSESLLESAIDRPKTKLSGYEPYSDVVRKAIALSYAIISWHPFLDGNKRTAVYILVDSLYTNWINISIPVYMAKYTISVAMGENSSRHMSEDEFYKKILPLCSRNIIVKFLKDIRYKNWTIFRFRVAMKFGYIMFNYLNDMVKSQNSRSSKKYFQYLINHTKNFENLFEFLFSRPIDWYGAGDLNIFLNRIREIEERRKQGYPKEDILPPSNEEGDYISDIS